jgi:hypothetical protein
MTAGLQVLDQQSLGPFDRHRQPLAMWGELGVELDQAGNIMGPPEVRLALAGAVDDAQLVVLATPVDPDEHLPFS